MSEIQVIWAAETAGRGIYNCTQMLNDMFDRYDVQHFAGKNPKGPFGGGGVVVVHGGRMMGEIDRLNMLIDNLEWVVLIFLGDEEASFPIEQVEHENKIVWVQEPFFGRPGHNLADRYILDGYSHECRRYANPGHHKDLEWFFAGQVTHERRRDCVNALQSIDWGGVIVESKGYTLGIPVDAYFGMMNRAHIVPCPSGPMAQDSARPWETLECGGIPILDAVSPARMLDPDFWEAVIPGHPFKVMRDWSQLPTIIDNMKRLNLETLHREANIWWSAYKWEFNHWLQEDLAEFGIEAKYYNGKI